MDIDEFLYHNQNKLYFPEPQWKQLPTLPFIGRYQKPTSTAWIENMNHEHQNASAR